MYHSFVLKSDDEQVCSCLVVHEKVFINLRTIWLQYGVNRLRLLALVIKFIPFTRVFVAFYFLHVKYCF